MSRVGPGAMPIRLPTPASTPPMTRLSERTIPHDRMVEKKAASWVGSVDTGGSFSLASPQVCVPGRRARHEVFP